MLRDQKQGKEQENRCSAYAQVIKGSPPSTSCFSFFYSKVLFSQAIMLFLHKLIYSLRTVHWLPNVTEASLRISIHAFYLKEWGTPKRQYSQIIYLSGTLGAKQDVVEWTHRMLSGPSSWTLASTVFRSVRSSSPSKTFSITTGSKPKQANQKSKC